MGVAVVRDAFAVSAGRPRSGPCTLLHRTRLPRPKPLSPCALPSPLPSSRVAPTTTRSPPWPWRSSTRPPQSLSPTRRRWAARACVGAVCRRREGCLEVGVGQHPRAPPVRAAPCQVVANCKALAARLVSHGYSLVTGGTDNHLILWDLRPLGITGGKVGAGGRARVQRALLWAEGRLRGPGLVRGGSAGCGRPACLGQCGEAHARSRSPPP